METSAKTGHNARNVLVEAAKILYKDYLAFDEKNKDGEVKEVVVTVNPIDKNNVIGQKRENITTLKELYDVDLIVKTDESDKKKRAQKVIDNAKKLGAESYITPEEQMSQMISEANATYSDNINFSAQKAIKANFQFQSRKS